MRNKGHLWPHATTGVSDSEDVAGSASVAEDGASGAVAEECPMWMNASDGNTAPEQSSGEAVVAGQRSVEAAIAGQKIGEAAIAGRSGDVQVVEQGNGENAE